MLKEYEVGSRNIHHHPLMKSTTIDVPGNSSEFIDSGNVGVQNGNEFHLEPPTEFEYSKNSANNQEISMAVETVDMMIAEALKRGYSYPQIKLLIEEFMGKGNQKKSLATNGTDKEGSKPEKKKNGAGAGVDNPENDEDLKEAIIEKALTLGLSYPDIKSILEVADSAKHSYPYESDGHVDAKAAIKTPWPQTPSDSEPKPGAEQEFRSPPQGKSPFTDAQDPGKKNESAKKDKYYPNPEEEGGMSAHDVANAEGNDPEYYAAEKKKNDEYRDNKKKESIRKALMLGLSFDEAMKISEIMDKNTPKSANIDRNDEKDTDNTPEGAEDDVKKSKNHQIESTEIGRYLRPLIDMVDSFSRSKYGMEWCESIGLEEAAKFKSILRFVKREVGQQEYRESKWIQKAKDKMEKKGTVGKFSAKAKKAGESTEEYAKEKKKAGGKLGKEANFALNVKK